MSSKEFPYIVYLYYFNILFIYVSLQQKVVIKYVIKSRILVDCWTRDRKLGTIPVEIHILHTLRKLPHENLGDMRKLELCAQNEDFAN